jgi:hypothetical protein
MLQELMDVVIILMEGPNMLIGATNAPLDHCFYMFILCVYKKMFLKIIIIIIIIHYIFMLRFILNNFLNKYNLKIF